MILLLIGREFGYREPARAIAQRRGALAGHVLADMGGG